MVASSSVHRLKRETVGPSMWILPVVFTCCRIYNINCWIYNIHCYRIVVSVIALLFIAHKAAEFEYTSITCNDQCVVILCHAETKGSLLWCPGVCVCVRVCVRRCVCACGLSQLMEENKLNPWTQALCQDTPQRQVILLLPKPFNLQPLLSASLAFVVRISTPHHTRTHPTVFISHAGWRLSERDNTRALFEAWRSVGLLVPAACVWCEPSASTCCNTTFWIF